MPKTDIIDSCKYVEPEHVETFFKGSLRDWVESFEKMIIKDTLSHSKTQKDAARELWIDPAVLSRKIQCIV